MLICALLFSSRVARAAEATTGTISGTVSSSAGATISGITVVAIAASGRYSDRTDARGRFVLFAVAADTYTIRIDAPEYEPLARSGVTVTPGARVVVDVTLVPRLRTIATVHSQASAFSIASTSDQYAVTGARARASYPVAQSAGLGSYTTDSVQGAVAGVPGIVQDSFAKPIVRGGTVDDAAFEYDSVPIPQGLVAEPGGNIVGAQLPTTGDRNDARDAGRLFIEQAENALGGIIDRFRSTGVYPARTDDRARHGASVRRPIASRYNACGRRRIGAGVTPLRRAHFERIFPVRRRHYILSLRSRNVRPC